MATETRNLNDSLVKVSVFKTLYTEIINKITSVSNSIKNSTIKLTRKSGDITTFTLNQATDATIDITPKYADITSGLGFTPADNSIVVYQSTKDTELINLEGASIADLNEAVAKVSNTKLETDLTDAEEL